MTQVRDLITSRTCSSFCWYLLLLPVPPPRVQRFCAPCSSAHPALPEPPVQLRLGPIDDHRRRRAARTRRSATARRSHTVRATNSRPAPTARPAPTRLPARSSWAVTAATVIGEAGRSCHPRPGLESGGAGQVTSGGPCSVTREPCARAASYCGGPVATAAAAALTRRRRRRQLQQRRRRRGWRRRRWRRRRHQF